MAWMKRVFLFVTINILVVFTLSVLLRILNIGPYLTAYGIDYSNLMGFCLVWGMGGAFISLAMSRVMAKWLMGVHLIDPATRDSDLQQLLQMVYHLARGAGLSVMPEVGIYDSPEVNAFATGPTSSRALVAVSSGLLSRMNIEEMRGVLGHEGQVGRDAGPLLVADVCRVGCAGGTLIFPPASVPSASQALVRMPTNQHAIL